MLAKVNYKGFIAPLIVGIALILLMPFRPAAITPAGWEMFAIFLATIIACITKPLPIAGVSIIAYVLIVGTGLVQMKPALAAFGDSTPWTIAMAYMIARGFTKTGLGRRIALVFVRSFGKKTLGLGYSLSMIDLVVSPATPSNTARSGGIVLPIIESLSDTFGSKVSDGTEKKIGSYLIFNEFHANTISSSLFMTASAPNVAAVGLAAANGVKISWFGWLAAAVVPAVISFILVPIIIYKMYPPEIKETPNAKEWADSQLSEMGPMKTSEKVMMVIFILALVLWMLSSFIKLDATWVAFLATALLLVTGVLTTKDMLGETGAWNVVIWFSILIFMANQLSAKGGVIPWMQTAIKSVIGGMSPVLVMAILVLVYFYSHYLFASGTAHVVAMYAPLLLIAKSAGVPVMFAAIMLGMTGAIFQSTTHYSCGPATALFAPGYVKQTDWWKMNFVLGLFYLVVYGIIGGLWMKLIGLW
ncbi:2-oxoglutarate malate translocator [Lactobacillus equicursoris DSM 19284 = JCM 14600 = CIP 110162]|uniref:2-oxoglutarate malate translocator n=3 Tax=Lactobacillus equicursoris TaxID=420645 RepID=A0A0R1LZ61_9LACO|nr:DASS family sodium-coupled anion symporter [Lactobacillus equicursoris]KRL00950.1 2-oxoglutarate malate translocator [Lactobacillus equicursoris DSM 19284 = JCM 14600 = CIP 110162]MDD6385751.1 DASS family sodium-coupled anion symporter [Lactobacillus equicursoris]